MDLGITCSLLKSIDWILHVVYKDNHVLIDGRILMTNFGVYCLSVLFFQVMPPHDLFYVNPVYQQGFFEAYCEFFVNHPELDIYPTYLVEESELLEGEVDDGVVVVDDDDDESDDGVNAMLQEANWLIMELLETFDVMYPGTGTEDDPIDLTCDE